MKKINLKQIFNKIYKEKYVICKLKDIFPDYEFGSDLDILAAEPVHFVKEVMSELNKYIDHESKVNIEEVSETQIHVDFCSQDGIINIRFDIYGALPNYSKLNIDRSLFNLIIANRESKRVNGVDLYVPSIIDESLIRFFEYIEYYEIRPDKLKHLHFIVNQLQNDKDSEEFFSRLHLYTKLSLLPIPENTHFSRKVIEDTEGIISNINEEIDLNKKDIEKLQILIEKYIKDLNKKDIEKLQILIEKYIKDLNHSDDIIVSIDKRIQHLEDDMKNFLSSDIFRFGSAIMNPLKLPSKFGRLIKRKIKRVLPKS